MNINLAMQGLCTTLSPSLVSNSLSFWYQLVTGGGTASIGTWKFGKISTYNNFGVQENQEKNLTSKTSWELTLTFTIPSGNPVLSIVGGALEALSNMGSVESDGSPQPARLYADTWNLKINQVNKCGNHVNKSGSFGKKASAQFNMN